MLKADSEAQALANRVLVDKVIDEAIAKDKTSAAAAASLEALKCGEVAEKLQNLSALFAEIAIAASECARSTAEFEIGLRQLRQAKETLERSANSRRIG